MKVNGFNWDRGNWPKCGKHGVKREEIEYVLTNNPMIKADRYPEDIETRFNAVGKTKENRYLFVVFTLRSNNLIRPISARYMHTKEIRHYEQQTKA